MSALLAVVERAQASNVLLVEEYLARAGGGGGEAEIGVPAAAGGAL